jgi:hypothetical protein
MTLPYLNVSERMNSPICSGVPEIGVALSSPSRFSTSGFSSALRLQGLIGLAQVLCEELGAGDAGPKQQALVPV